MARDGVWRTEVPKTLLGNAIDLTGASRADLAVRCSTDSTISVNSTTVANVVADGSLPTNPNANVGPYAGGSDPLSGSWFTDEWRPDYLRDLRSESGTINTETINMGARTVNGAKFDAEVPLFSVDTNAIQEWNIKGATNHPFHLHVYHVQMQSACGAFEGGEYYDTVAASCLTRFDTNETTSSVYDGRTILHCHILEHEDQGAMGWVDVQGGIAAPTLPGTKQALYHCGDPIAAEDICDDGVDDDNDGLIDGDDPDCGGGQCVPDASKEKGGKCSDGIDNDCDGFIDGNDPDCGGGGCTVTEDPEVSCADGVDNDCDTFIDTDDSDCQAPPACNNNGLCEAGEDCETCSSDCAGQTSGKPANRFCCGNGVPEGPEGDGTICEGNF